MVVKLDEWERQKVQHHLANTIFGFTPVESLMEAFSEIATLRGKFGDEPLINYLKKKYPESYNEKYSNMINFLKNCSSLAGRLNSYRAMLKSRAKNMFKKIDLTDELTREYIHNSVYACNVLHKMYEIMFVLLEETNIPNLFLTHNQLEMAKSDNERLYIFEEKSDEEEERAYRDKEFYEGV